MGAAEDDDLGNRRVGGDHALDESGPDLFAAGDDDVGDAAGDLQSAGVGVPRAGVAGGEPAVRCAGVVAVAVGPQQHGRPDVDLAGVVGAQLDAVQWHPVVDHTAAGLGEAVGGHGVGGQVGWHGRAA